MNDSQCGVFASQSVSDVARLVGAAIVHGNNLKAVKPLVQHTPQTRLNIVTFVIDWYHYRHFYVLFLFHAAKIVKKNVIVKLMPFFFITFAK